MFWGFAFRLWIGAFIAPFVMSFMVVPLFYLTALTMRGRTDGAPRSTLLTYPMMVLTGGAQVYFWGLWAAYCAALVVSRTAHPEVTHKWLYYAVAVQSLITPLAYLMSKEMSGATQREVDRITKGTMFYNVVALAAFLGFVFWPGLIYVPYGWASGVLAPVQVAQKDTPLRPLEEKYYADLDAWVARGPVFQPGVQVDQAAFQARVQPMVETCGKLIMVTATPQQRVTFQTTERSEFDFRVDVCSKMTINRIHEQPEFQKPELVRQICNSTIPVFRELCVRSGLRK